MCFSHLVYGTAEDSPFFWFTKVKKKGEVPPGIAIFTAELRGLDDTNAKVLERVLRVLR